jgi:hypothetical protein
MEAKKQNEFNLKKQIMDMESEERLRIDEVMFQRKQDRAIPEAQTAAKASVAGQVTTLDERSKTDLAAREAKNKVAGINAELSAMSESGIYDKQAKAKYDALNAEIDAAEKSGYDVKEARRTANALKAKFSAEEEAGIPKLQANRDATQRLENARALIEKNVATEEATLFAKQELAKVQAMTAQGVPEAEAKLLAAKWKAQKTQRDEAAAEKTQQEMKDLITRMQDPNYTKAMKKKEVIEATGGLLLQANREKKEKTERPRNTADMQRQITATERQIADALGVEPKKANDEKQYLEDRAATGKATPAEKAKLAKIKPLSDELDDLRRELRSFKRSDSSSPSEKTSYDYVPGKGLVETKK